MLRLPNKSIGRSVERHNNHLPVLADWVEASLLLDEPEVSMSSVVDMLVEQQIYDSQDFCSERVADVWAELRRREKCAPCGALRVRDDGFVSSDLTWDQVPASTFCLVLSLLPYYNDVSGSKSAHEEFGPDYQEQGELFELLTQASLQSQWNNWVVAVTGWSRSETSKLPEVVKRVCDCLGEDPGNLKKWAPEKANEAGLDLVMWRSFPDNRPGPRFFLQAGSGVNWPEKIGTPSLPAWRKFVDFTIDPSPALAIPFALDSSEFAKRTVRVQGLLLDRYRLLSCEEPEAVWMPEPTRDRLVAWLRPRVAWLASGAVRVVDDSM